MCPSEDYICVTSPDLQSAHAAGLSLLNPAAHGATAATTCRCLNTYFFLLKVIAVLGGPAVSCLFGSMTMPWSGKYGFEPFFRVNM